MQPLVDLEHKIPKNRSLGRVFKKLQLQVLHWGGESSNNEADADFDGDKGLYVGRDGQSQLIKILMFLATMATHWNSIFYLIKRALLLKNTLIMFTTSMQLTCKGEASPPSKSVTNDSAEVFL